MLTRLLATGVSLGLANHDGPRGKPGGNVSSSLFEQLSRTDSTFRASVSLRTLARGQHLFRPLETRAHVYSICRGALKTYRCLHDYSERICGFHFRNELLGLDALLDRPLRRGAVALTASTVFMIPVTLLVDRIGRCEVTGAELLGRFYDEIVGLEEHLSLGELSAEGRLAALLLWIVDKLMPEVEEPAFRLPMLQKDIGNYLGLVPETVSRVLARFEERELLLLRRREIRVRNLQQLRVIAAGADGRPEKDGWAGKFEAVGT